MNIFSIFFLTSKQPQVRGIDEGRLKNPGKFKFDTFSLCS